MYVCYTVLDSLQQHPTLRHNFRPTYVSASGRVRAPPSPRVSLRHQTSRKTSSRSTFESLMRRKLAIKGTNWKVTKPDFHVTHESDNASADLTIRNPHIGENEAPNCACSFGMQNCYCHLESCTIDPLASAYLTQIAWRPAPSAVRMRIRVANRWNCCWINEYARCNPHSPRWPRSGTSRHFEGRFANRRRSAKCFCARSSNTESRFNNPPGWPIGSLINRRRGYRVLFRRHSVWRTTNSCRARFIFKSAPRIGAFGFFFTLDMTAQWKTAQIWTWCICGKQLVNIDRNNEARFIPIIKMTRVWYWLPLVDLMCNGPRNNVWRKLWNELKPEIDRIWEARWWHQVMTVVLSSDTCRRRWHDSSKTEWDFIENSRAWELDDNWKVSRSNSLTGSRRLTDDSIQQCNNSAQIFETSELLHILFCFKHK